ncbi:phage baseplate protein [Klebsiella oxytoca]|uniref:phage baseplate protein n=1 Tax=Klebsiella oxytoca TaxID=571 RepID=UPI001EEB18A7|nr:hypothetical protein [Klebsiella oxytoca]
MAERTEVYGIYSDKFTLRFEKMKLLKASVMRESKLMEHPLEDGSTITDHRILLPVEIDLPVLLPAGDYQSLYREINKAWIGAELFTIHTRAGIFKSMAFAAMPHDESSEQLDVIPMVLRFKEVRLVTTQYQALSARKVARPRDQSTVNRGEQTGIVKKNDTLLDQILF